MKTIGIKLADGSFYPVLEDNSNQEKTLDLTTANNNQTTVMVDLYRSSLCSMEDAEYVDGFIAKAKENSSIDFDTFTLNANTQLYDQMMV